jgi:pilus assembly protein Flp/PilA
MAEARLRAHSCRVDKKDPSMSAIWKLIRDNRGVGAIEYALVASLISVAAVAAFDNLGGEVRQKYEHVDSKLGDGIKYKK